MIWISLLISILTLLSACTQRQYETVEIVAKESQNGQIVVRGMGVKFSDDSVLTSAHVVRDDRLVYEISGIRYQVSERDSVGDRAILSQNQNPKLQIYWNVSSWGQDSLKKTTTIQKWDPIYTEVSRSGSIVRITGKVLDPRGSVTGYDTTGRVVTLSGIVLTDIDLQPGDSGAPIYTPEWEIVDVVHVR
jgi:V8-like Glu-specific endopeptidase